MSNAAHLMKKHFARIPSHWTGMISHMRLALFLLPCMVWTVSVVSGQTNTTVNLGTQSRNPDFSAMPVTRPATVGTSLPSTCVVGQLFFNTAATAGNNLSSCTATNRWTAVGGFTSPLAVASGGTGSSSPSLVAGTNVTITGSWPNQTVSSSGGGTSGNATSIQGATVSSSAPANNQTLVFNSTASSYVPTSIFTLQNGLGTVAAGASTLQINVSMGVRAVTTTVDNVIPTDCGGLVTYNNASAVAVSLPAPGTASNFATGCPITVRNYGAGSVTITPATPSTIGSAASQTVNPSKACLLVSDGTNWQLGNCN